VIPQKACATRPTRAMIDKYPQSAPSFDERAVFSAARTFYPQLLFPPLTINNF
jgi:hypothetical protein